MICCCTCVLAGPRARYYTGELRTVLSIPCEVEVRGGAPHLAADFDGLELGVLEILLIELPS
jgi:hypothetical protein